MSRLQTLLEDRRARVPFALIGLALLLLSATFVVQLETSEQPEPELETDRAMDQTEAATETALTDALRAATRRAATEPVTEPEDTAYGEILDDGDTFERYLKALVYLEAQTHLSEVGQTVGAVETEVSIPEIDNSEEFAAALERVTIRPGSETDGIEKGIIEAEISGVETVATADGDQLAREAETVTVAIASPLYQLHDRTERFEQRLDAPINKPGFAQRFNARIYALGWARGYAQYSGLPVTEVIANRHIVPSANDAVYRTQKDVFGAADPELSNAIRKGWLCMAMHDAEGLYSNYAGKAPPGVAKQLCAASTWLFGNQATGDVPDSPGVPELLGEAPGMDATHTIGVNETSLLPIRDLASGSGSNSLSAVLDRVYEVRVESAVETTELSDPVFSHSEPVGTIHSRVVETETAEVEVFVDNTSDPTEGPTFWTIEGTVAIELRQTKEYVRVVEGERETTESTASGTRRVAFTLTFEEQRRNPSDNIDEYNHAGPSGLPIDEEYVYGAGPPVAEAATDRTIPVGGDNGTFGNYGGPRFDVLGSIFDRQPDSEDDESVTGNDDHDESFDSRVEEQLAEKWAGVKTAGDLELSENATIALQVENRNALRAAIVYDLRQIQQNVADITHTFERSELVHDGSDTGPVGELREKVSERKERYLDREEPFASIGQKAVYEARFAYFAALEEYLSQAESAHGAAMTELEDRLPDTGIENAMTFLQQGVTATPPEPVPLNSSSLTEDVHYEVSGSPTYLVTERVTSETVPAVEDGEQFAPMAAKNRNYLKLPYKSVVQGLLSSIGNKFGLSEPEAQLTFQSASEALVAGSEAVDAAEADPDHGDPEKLRSMTEDLRDAVGESVDTYTKEVAAQIAYRLYPDDVEVNLRGLPEADIDDCDSIECIDVPQDCTYLLCQMESDSMGEKSYDTVTNAVSDAIENYGNTADTADAIASGNISEAIVDELVALDEDTRPAYADGMSDAEWRAVVMSGARRTVRDAAGEQTIELSNTDTVERLDTEIRQTLEGVSKELLKKRFESAVGQATFNLDNYENWVNGTRTPVKVPAGMPLIPLPGQWYATVNIWTVNVRGEYARFEVSANMGTPETATATTYVREDRDVSLQIAGASREVGEVEELDFSETSVLIVVVPPGGIGVGDRDDQDPECSPTHPETGYVSGSGGCGGTTNAPALGLPRGGR
jgi:hypothetical protein